MNANAAERLAAWLSTDIGPVLRAQGMTKGGANFHLRGSDGWGVVNFQKSPWGSQAETSFTVNLGVALDRLAPIFDRDPTKKPPASMCNWSTRVGELLDPARDTWWSVDDGTDFVALTEEVVPALVELALPAIKERLTAGGFLRAMRLQGAIGQVAFPWKVLELLEATPGAP